MVRLQNELSIFVDESGDFGAYDYKSPYYIISMVFHNQSQDLKMLFRKFDKTLSETALKRNFVHMGPLIRREYEYKVLSVEERRQIYHRMRTFVERTDFLYKSFIVEKKHLKNNLEIINKLAQQISFFIKDNFPYFGHFDKIKIYYDNGQSGVMGIISTVFTVLFNDSEIKMAQQKDYKMLQIADFICTMSLEELKLKSHTITSSERRVLGDEREIHKTLKKLKRKEFKNSAHFV